MTKIFCMFLMVMMSFAISVSPANAAPKAPSQSSSGCGSDYHGATFEDGTVVTMGDGQDYECVDGVWVSVGNPCTCHPTSSAVQENTYQVAYSYDYYSYDYSYQYSYGNWYE